VVLEALKERSTLAVLSYEYEISYGMLSRWMSEFLKAAPVVFQLDKKIIQKHLRQLMSGFSRK
jgi:hypothetical protein